mmetsp:Transcript_14634/g.43943  ORF Transcript_14634/g.43943 Transcript_14634/m.43943 type:complete len:120 (-) Transcript_14634:596-955(-)
MCASAGVSECEQEDCTYSTRPHTLSFSNRASFSDMSTHLPTVTLTYSFTHTITLSHSHSLSLTHSLTHTTHNTTHIPRLQHEELQPKERIAPVTSNASSPEDVHRELPAMQRWTREQLR